MAPIGSDTLYGTLNLLILKSLADGPRHGLAIARRVHRITEETLRIEEGALYPALHRMERDGFLTSSWGRSENNRRAKFYELTLAGRRELRREVERWTRHAGAVARVLELDGQTE